MDIPHQPLFQAITEQSGEGISLADAAGNYILVNHAFCQMTGYSEMELLAMNVRDVMPSETEIILFPKVVKNQSGRRETELLRKDGSRFLAEIRGYPIHWADQRLVLGIVRDIAERKQTVTQLERQLAFSQALNQIADAVVTQDDAESILSASAQVMGETLQVDRSLIYDILFDDQLVVGLCEWLNPARPGITPTKDTYPLSMFSGGAAFMQETHRWLESHNEERNPHLIQDGSAQILHEQMSIQSLLWYPFAFRADGFYLLVFNQVSHRRHWEPDELAFMDAATRQASLALQKLALLAERKQAAARIEELAEFNENIVALAPVGIVTVNRKGEVTSANDAFLKMMGSPDLEETLELGMSIPAIKKAGIDAAFNKVLTSGETFSVNKLPYSSHWGKELIVNLKVVPQKTKDGRISGMIVVVDDVTTAAQAETLQTAVYRIAQAADRAAHLDELFPTIHEIIQTVMPADNFYIALYDETADLLRFPYCVDERTPDPISSRRPGKGWTEFILRHGVSQLVDAERHQAMMAQGEVESYGSLAAVYLGVPLIVESQTIGVMAVQCYDDPHVYGEPERHLLEYVAYQTAQIIDRKQKEEDLRESNRQLQAALAKLKETQEKMVQRERLAAVGQLAAGMAHDFNNIMTVIVLYTEMGLRLPDLSSKLQERLQTVLHQAWRATELVQQILDFSRRAVLEPRPMDVAPFLKEQVKLLARTLPESIQIDLDCGTDEYTVNADPTRLQQVVVNLVVNARDAMPDGGELRLALARVETAGETICTVCQQPIVGEWVRLQVSDSGGGIPPAALPRIFEPFFTTKQAGRGSGLGLSQVSGIVDQHGGHTTVVSRKGKGATFAIYLPALLAMPGDKRPSETATLPLGSDETVLVVEDDDVTREALTNIITLLNYRVLTAANGREALTVLEQRGQEIALVLSDLVMPGMGGQTLFQEMRRRGLTLPVVMLTGHPLESDLQRLQEQGLAGWLLKPPDMEKLARLLARALRQGGKQLS